VTVVRELNTVSHAIETALREWGPWLPRNPVKMCPVSERATRATAPPRSGRRGAPPGRPVSPSVSVRMILSGLLGLRMQPARPAPMSGGLAVKTKKRVGGARRSPSFSERLHGPRFLPKGLGLDGLPKGLGLDGLGLADPVSLVGPHFLCDGPATPVEIWIGQPHILDIGGRRSPAAQQRDKEPSPQGIGHRHRTANFAGEVDWRGPLDLATLTPRD